MVDTIIMRIHNLKSKYEPLAKLLTLQSKADNAKIKFNSPESEKDNVKDFQLYADSDKIRFLSYRNNFNVYSSNYDLNYHLNYERDYIEFNFSIPKYIFGTNVFQFTDYRHIEIHSIWNKLENFILQFFRENCPVIPDYDDIEVNRLDMCLNQIFASKEDALEYLKHQKELNVAFARSDDNKFNEYGSTTIQHITGNYTFKIYHKGTEFRRNDLKELVKSNPLNYDLKELNDVAERILRYEITYRKSGFSYIWRQKVKNDINTMFNHNFERLSKTRTKQVRDFMDDTGTKAFGFYLSSIWDRLDGTPRELIQEKKLTFNYELFYALNDFFMERVQNYQLNEKLSISDMYDKIRQSSDIKKAINNKGENNNMILLTAVLAQYTNIETLKDIMPKASYYRLKAKLKAIGIEKRGIDNIKAPDLDFSDYFNLLGKYHIRYN